MEGILSVYEYQNKCVHKILILLNNRIQLNNIKIINVQNVRK